MGIFIGSAIVAIVRRPFRFFEVVVHFDFIGARSTGLVALAAIFTGLVLALQGYNVLVRFGSENQVGTLVALSLVRELSPVLTALMVSARAGSAITAIIGNMAVTEQIDALRSLSVDPIKYMVAPRLLAATIAMPILTAIFSVAGIGAAYVFGVRVLGLDGLSFMSNIRRSVEWSDVSVGLFKGVVFGILIASVATFRGYHTRGGAAGVGRSTTRSVVDSAVLVLGGDYVLTALFF
jgi:phospholipid/cholesterol/gamma-HCH transport system permease protein